MYRNFDRHFSGLSLLTAPPSPSPRFGHHGAAALLLRPLLSQVSTEQMQFWLSALLELSEAEATLAAAAPEGGLSALSEAAQRYARGLATLRVRGEGEGRRAGG